MSILNDSAATRSERVNAVRNTIKENKICADVGKVLVAHYPGWAWSIETNLDTGCVTIKCLNLHGDYGFLLYINQVDVVGGSHAAVTAAGELLERCNIPRGKKPEDLIINKDVKGNITTMDKHMSGRS